MNLLDVTTSWVIAPDYLKCVSKVYYTSFFTDGHWQAQVVHVVALSKIQFTKSVLLIKLNGFLIISSSVKLFYLVNKRRGYFIRWSNIPNRTEYKQKLSRLINFAVSSVQIWLKWVETTVNGTLGHYCCNLCKNWALKWPRTGFTSK